MLVRIQQSIQAGELLSARVEIRNAFQALPDDPRLYNFLGVIDAQEDRFDNAEANFQRAIKIAPRFIGAYMNLGRLYQQESPKHPGSEEKALTAYRQVITVAPDNIDAAYQVALLLNHLGRFDSSLRQLSVLPPEAQHQPLILSLKSDDEAALQHKDLATASARELATLPGLTEADVLPVVPSLVKHDQPDLAIIVLESLAKREAVSTAALEQLAALYEGQGQLDSARRTLTKELERGGQTSAALLNRLARIAYKSGDLEGALGYLAHARDLEPNNASIHFLFGLVCIELKLPPEAEDSLKKAVRLDPRNPYYNYALGAVLLERRNPDEAIQCFRSFRDAERQDPRGSFALAVAYFDADQSEAARREFESIIDRPETRAGALLYLGRLALRDQNLKEAADQLAEAIQTNPTMVQPYVELASVQTRCKEYKAAEQNLHHALQLAPDDYQANLNLLLFYKRTNDPRSEGQSRRVAVLRDAAEERERMLLRALDIRPF